MQLRHLFAATALIFAIASPGFAAGGKPGGFKCWVNKQGIRECGNEVPPEYSQGETRTVNKYGITTKIDPSAREQAEAEKRAQQQDAAQNGSQNAGLSKEQQAYDRVLLASYLSEDDINAARKRKLTAIDATIEMSNNSIAKLQEKLNKEQQKADSLKKSGKEMGADEKGDMEALQKELNDKKVFVAAKQKEHDAINIEYDGYVKRFRELKAK